MSIGEHLKTRAKSLVVGVRESGRRRAEKSCCDWRLGDVESIEDAKSEGRGITWREEMTQLKSEAAGSGEVGGGSVQSRCRR